MVTKTAWHAGYDGPRVKRRIQRPVNEHIYTNVTPGSLQVSRRIIRRGQHVVMVKAML